VPALPAERGCGAAPPLTGVVPLCVVPGGAGGAWRFLKAPTSETCPSDSEGVCSSIAVAVAGAAVAGAGGLTPAPPAWFSWHRSWCQCSLHLHSVTDSRNVGLVFSAEAAVGLAAGVGNVGDHLLAYEEGDTFLTNDGGVTWKKVRKGPHLHEFADWGAIVVLVNDKDPTQHVRYARPPCHWWRWRWPQTR